MTLWRSSRRKVPADLTTCERCGEEIGRSSLKKHQQTDKCLAGYNKRRAHAAGYTVDAGTWVYNRLAPVMQGGRLELPRDGKEIEFPGIGLYVPAEWRAPSWGRGGGVRYSFFAKPWVRPLLDALEADNQNNPVLKRALEHARDNPDWAAAVMAIASLETNRDAVREFVRSTPECGSIPGWQLLALGEDGEAEEGRGEVAGVWPAWP